MSSAVSFARRRGAAIAFVLLAFFGGIAINQSAKSTARQTAKQAALVVYKSQYAGCLRGNKLRVEINHRVGETNVTRTVVVSFLESAARAREANYKATHLKADKVAAKAYASLADKERELQYHTVPIVNCNTAVQKP